MGTKTNTKSYWEKLKDPRWQKRRLEIMERDEFTCQHCRSKEKTLNVHHKFYKKGADPWDYEDWQLITLCEDCHAALEKAIKEFSAFVGEHSWHLTLLHQHMTHYDAAGVAVGVLNEALSGVAMSYADFLNQLTVASQDIPGCVGKGLSAGFQSSLGRLVREAALALDAVEKAIIEAAGEQ